MEGQTNWYVVVLLWVGGEVSGYAVMREGWGKGKKGGTVQDDLSGG